VDAGAAYVFTRSGTIWSQQAYLKASNTGAGDDFGYAVALSGDTLVVGANTEDSNATGVGGNQNDNSAVDAGATYVFTSLQVQLAIANQVQRINGTTSAVAFTVTNQGPDAAGGLRVQIPLASNLSSMTWGCAAAGGATCPATSGSGALDHVILAFPPGGQLTYTLTGSISNPFLPMQGTASFTPPTGTTLTSAASVPFGEYVVLLPIAVRASATP
jgi:hypothetical protein